jgi:hypothetical protein
MVIPFNTCCITAPLTALFAGCSFLKNGREEFPCPSLGKANKEYLMY